MPTDPAQSVKAPRIRVLVADDSPAFTTAVTHLLNRLDGVSVVATAGDGEEAIEQFIRHEPDLAIVDVEMPRMNGLDAAAQLRQRSATVRILMVSIHGSSEIEADCRRSGADAFVSKIGIQRRLCSEIAGLFPAGPLKGCDEQ